MALQSQCFTTGQHDFLVPDWLMMLMMSSTNGGSKIKNFCPILADKWEPIYCDTRQCPQIKSVSCSYKPKQAVLNVPHVRVNRWLLPATGPLRGACLNFFRLLFLTSPAFLPSPNWQVELTTSTVNTGQHYTTKKLCYRMKWKEG